MINISRKDLKIMKAELSCRLAFYEKMLNVASDNNDLKQFERLQENIKNLSPIIENLSIELDDTNKSIRINLED